ncbi:hypothetical protein J3Q64DRAFT_1644723 [Phycomyces blakesleeanus]|uniref:EH domain-containing protein n=1 Tax=Phycomyces blakesleeanus TaxID=4837 RepID=A0ABR3ARF0_PHYBL
MNKIKNTLFHSKNKDEKNRKAHHLGERSISDPVLSQASISEPEPSTDVPEVGIENLTDIEQQIYTVWWNELDPYSLGHLDNKALLKFLVGCNLEYQKLGQILALFDKVTDGLTESQFYAVLRLVSHAQNGRAIHRDLCYLGGKFCKYNTIQYNIYSGFLDLKTNLENKKFKC